MATQANGYKIVFEFPRVIEDLLTGFLDEPWLADLDWETLELVPGDFVTEDFKRRSNDLLWRIYWKGQDRCIYIYLLLEIQSVVQWHMAVRVAIYELLLYQQLIRTDKVKNGEPLPPIFGMVLYTGEARWNAANDIGDLIAPLPGAFPPSHPRMGYHLFDEKELAARGIPGIRNVASALFRLKQAATAEEALAIMGELGEWLKEPEQTDLRLALGEWLRLVLLPLRAPRAKLPVRVDILEAKRTMAEQTIDWSKPFREEGLKEGLKEGRKEGRKEGESAFLIHVLHAKFGTVPRTVRQQIASADAMTLLKWGERVLTAERMEEVFE